MLRVQINGESYAFHDTEIATIGRHHSSTIHLQDRRISRQHARLYFDDGWVLEDLDSSNGTFCDGERLTRLRLVSDTRVSLGSADDGVLLELMPETGPEEDQHAGTSVEPVHEQEPSTEMVARSLGPMSFIHTPKESVVRIGRSSDNDIVVRDLLVSRSHAVLKYDPMRGYELIDLDSYNGTYVDGKRITRSIITEANYITIGHSLFRLVDGSLEEYIDTGEVTFEAAALTVRAPGGQVLLDDVSFSLEKCAFMAVVGPSGAGKSTLVNALTGFNPAQEGSVIYAGRDLYESYEELNHRIGYVPQDDIIHAQLSVRQALGYAAELRFPPDVPAAEIEQRIEEVIGDLGLTERADLPISQLSGGQRKRASIALELLTKPSLLFLDEPTSGLDPGYEKATMRLLRDLADGGRTVLVITHSLQSLELCDRVLFLAAGGRVAYFGPPREALAFFGEEDFADVFERLDREHDVDWKGRFREHQAWDQYVGPPRRDRVVRSPRATMGTGLADSRQNWFQQFSTLARRYLAVIFSDRRNLMLLLLQAPILGLLILAIVPPGTFDLTSAPHSDAAMAALLLVLSVTLMGAVNAVREIVKEFPIYRRERSVGLSVSAYVASKVVVLSVFTVLQSILLVAIATLRLGGPQSAALFGWPLGELLITVSLAGLASMAFALMISALVTASDKAMTLLPLILIPQIMLSGPIIELEGKLVMHQLSYLASANWGFSGVASTIDLPSLQQLLFESSRWQHTAGVLLGNILALALLTLAPIAGTWFVLRRRDPAVLGNSAVMPRLGSLLQNRMPQGQLRNFTTETFVPRMLPGLAWALVLALLRRLF